MLNNWYTQNNSRVLECDRPGVAQGLSTKNYFYGMLLKEKRGAKAALNLITRRAKGSPPKKALQWKMKDAYST
jgi:hypothetical protein